MYIAICDDNIADRKQTERLLVRESERRSATAQPLYVRTFGHPDALLRTPMLYDLFLIDMTGGGMDGLALAMELIGCGVTAPICLTVSKIDYRGSYAALPDRPPQISFIDKPVKADALGEIVGQTLARRAAADRPIELRTDRETLYLMEDDIVSAVEAGRHTTLFLTDGREATVCERTARLYQQVCIYPSFFPISSKTFINIHHVEKCSLFHVTLKNGQRFSLSLPAHMALKKHI